MEATKLMGMWWKPALDPSECQQSMGCLPASHRWAQASRQAITQAPGGMLQLRSPSAVPVPSLPHDVCWGKPHAGQVPLFNQGPKETASSKDPFQLLFLYQNFTLPHSPLGPLSILQCWPFPSHLSKSLCRQLPNCCPRRAQPECSNNRGGLGKMLPPVPGHLGCRLIIFLSFCSAAPSHLFSGWKLLGPKRGQRLPSVSLGTATPAGVQRGWKLLKPG